MLITECRHLSITSGSLLLSVFLLLGPGVDAVLAQRIPEPMVFDLVRPLDARKGELEVNTLFVLPLKGGERTLEWAPEIEYAFADGHAIELEFPLEGGSLKDIKVALQGKFGGGLNERFIHGWQFIAKVNREDQTPTLDILHLAGYRFNGKWSLFSMQGMRRTRTDSGRQIKGLYNLSVFHEINRRVTGGIETNFEFGCPGCAQVLLMPQIHIEPFRKHVLQFGVGMVKQSGHRAVPALGWRLIREF